MKREDKCENCGNLEDLDYQQDTGEIGSEYELIETSGFECPLCKHFTVISQKRVITKDDEEEN